MPSNSPLNPPLSVTPSLDTRGADPWHGRWLLLAIYFVSGVTGLAYEVLWARMLSLQFGVSIFGVVITVAAFMAGLGGGSLLGARWAGCSSAVGGRSRHPASRDTSASMHVAGIRKNRRWIRFTSSPLLIFAALEGGVGLYALGIPWLQQGLDAALGDWGAQASLTMWYSLQGGAALLLLFVPALALGASFPLMLKALVSTSPAPTSLGMMYGLNALGGALGALLPLLLLPVLGWSKAVYVVAGISLCVAATAFLLSLRLGRAGRTSATLVDVPAISNPAPPLSGLSLLAYGGVGAAALMLQVGWTRLFGMILLRTEYVLAVLLAVFLIGIGAGSLLARSRMLLGTRLVVPGYWFAILPVLAGGMSLLGLACVPWLAEWVEQARFNSLVGALWGQGLAVAALTLPVTLVLGAWLPLLSAHMGGHSGTASWLYGINSLGAALGAVAAGFVFIPWLGTPATLCLAAALLFICGRLLCIPAPTALGHPVRRMAWAPRTAGARWSWVVMGVIGVLAWQGRLYELPPVQVLLPVTQAGSRDAYLYEDAISITHVVERPDGQRLLLADLQRMDASSDPTAVEAQQNQARLPLLLHPAPRSVLFLGLGTGISAAGSLPFTPLARTGVELSQGAISAAHNWFAPVNHNIMQQVHVVRNDARRFLRNDTAYYDVIIGDLFHPDLVGHSALLSVQQFQRARSRLTDDGVFVQWLALNQFDAGSLDIILRSFRRVFPNAVIFMDGFRLALVGPRATLQGVPAMLGNLNRLAPAEQWAATGGEGVWTWLGRYWGTIPHSSGPVQDEWAPQIEYRLPRVRYAAAGGGAGASRDTLNLGDLLSTLLERRPSLLQAATALNVRVEAMPEFERGYVASFLAVRSWVMGLHGDDTGQAQRLMRLAYEANPRDRWIGFDLADKMLATLPQAMERGIDKRRALQTILQIRPDHAEVLRALWQLEKDAGNPQAAAAYLTRLKVVSPLGR